MMKVLKTFALLAVLLLSGTGYTPSSPGGGGSSGSGNGGAGESERADGTVDDDDGPGTNDRPPEEWIKLLGERDFANLRASMDGEQGKLPHSEKLMLALVNLLELNEAPDAEVIAATDEILEDESSDSQLISLAEAVVFAAGGEKAHVVAGDLDPVYDRLLKNGG